MSEYVILQMLALTKKLREAEAVVLEASGEWGESRRTDENIFAYNWSGRQNTGAIFGQVIGILGFGEIGVELARRLRSWECQILYNKRNRLPESVEVELGVTYAEKEVIYAQSDFLANLLPYSPETDMALHARVFAQMKPGSFLVSAGSGAVIDELALAEAIKKGQLAGTALDTYEYEPIRADNPLIPLAKSGYNILLTPHVAAGGKAATVEMKDRFHEYSNILRHINHEPVLYRVV